MSIQGFVIFDESKHSALGTLFIFALICSECCCFASSTTGNDASATDMVANDPNLVNPPNKEGYGRNIATSISDDPGNIDFIYFIYHNKE